MQGEKSSRKSKQRNKCRKNNDRFKKLKLKKEKRKKKATSTELHKSNQRQRFITTVKNMTEKKKIKSLIRFHSANKLNNYTAGWGARKENKKKKKKSKRIYRTGQT